MIVHKVTLEDKTVFCGSESEAREKHAALCLNATLAESLKPFSECVEYVYVDPGKAGLLAVLNKQAGR